MQGSIADFYCTTPMAPGRKIRNWPPSRSFPKWPARAHSASSPLMRPLRAQEGRLFYVFTIPISLFIPSIWAFTFVRPGCSARTDLSIHVRQNLHASARTTLVSRPSGEAKPVQNGHQSRHHSRWQGADDAAKDSVRNKWTRSYRFADWVGRIV